MKSLKLLSFDDLYENLIEDFKQSDQFFEIMPCSEKIVWPDGQGVYVIWKKPKNTKNLIYVGMTGKLKRDVSTDKLKINSGTFKARASRTTPYRFCESKKDLPEYLYSFRYNPATSKPSGSEPTQYHTDAYEHMIKYEDLIIHIFACSQESYYTPSFLETLILNHYYKKQGRLPPANRAL